MSSTQPPAIQRLTSQLVQEDPEMRDIVAEFVQDLPKRLQKFRQAYVELDWSLLTTLAHQLKGAGGSYGYPAISNLCAQMEAAFATRQAENFNAWFQELNTLAAGAKSGLT
jgi:histidine phosphotransfer protein HptB